MARVRIAAEGPVGAEPALVYSLLADYRQHHPRILPPVFSDLTVEQGGVGAGTVFTYKLRLAGRTYPSRMAVTEPEPGHVLMESDGRLRTLFTVDPDGSGSRVRIETELEAPGLSGLIQRVLIPRLLTRHYLHELALLDRYARQQAESHSA